LLLHNEAGTVSASSSLIPAVAFAVGKAHGMMLEWPPAWLEGTGRILRGPAFEKILLRPAEEFDGCDNQER
jgi:hypothetical protein